MCQYMQPIQQRNLYLDFSERGFSTLLFQGQKILLSANHFNKDKTFLKLPISYELYNLAEGKICSQEQKEFLSKNIKRLQEEKFNALLNKEKSLEEIKEEQTAFKLLKRNYVKIYDNYETLFDTYLLNETTGEIIPVFLFVDCGKCPSCLAKKTLHISQKVLGQTEQEKIYPFFVTLTYDEKHYPKKDTSISLHVREIQLFLKRLRKRINDRFQIKYIAVSEFGKKLGRLHYHLLLFGFPSEMHDLIYFDNYATPFATEMIKQSWQKGHIKVVNSIDSNVSNYLTKYLTKQNNVKLQSHHLGKDFLLSYKDYIRNNNTNYIEYNTFDNKYTKIYVNSYLLNLSIPSLARLIPLEVRENIVRMLYNLSILKNESYYKYVMSFLEREFGNKFFDYFKIRPNRIIANYEKRFSDKKSRQILNELNISNQIHHTFNWIFNNKSLFLQGFENEDLREVRFSAITNIIEDETIKNYNIEQKNKKIVEYDGQ